MKYPVREDSPEQMLALIRYHEDLYRQGVPEISDAVFDALVQKYLKRIEAK
jgi:NAD-dependent DNA ligase